MDVGIVFIQGILFQRRVLIIQRQYYKAEFVSTARAKIRCATIQVQSHEEGCDENCHSGDLQRVSDC